MLYDAWKQYKQIWILKATGLGVTEFFLRLMLWLAVKDTTYSGTQFCIVVGPNRDLATKLIKRMKNIMRNVPSMQATGEETNTQFIIEINNVWFQAFPSNHLDAYRSLDKPKFIFIDESDFFRKGEQEEVRFVSERYIGKSQPYIIMVSTPGKPDGLMQRIELEEPSIYHKIKLGYELGIGKIYSQADIDRAKQSPSFEAEYNLKYLGKIGNIFSESIILKAIEIGERFKDVGIKQGCNHFGGIDPGFSKTTPVYIGEVDTENQVFRIVFCARYDKAIPAELIKQIHTLDTKYLNLHWFVDASNRGFINDLKYVFEESQDWDKPDDVSIFSSRIIPVNFGNHGGEQMLEHLHALISKGLVAIPQKYDKLITSLRTGRSTQVDQWQLDKDETVYDDDLDVLRMIVKRVKIE